LFYIKHLEECNQSLQKEIAALKGQAGDVWIDKELYDNLQDELAAAKKRIKELEGGEA
jgi:peptidoglycan hydrolase CwlO-like protein